MDQGASIDEVDSKEVVVNDVDIDDVVNNQVLSNDAFLVKKIPHKSRTMWDVSREMQLVILEVYKQNYILQE